MADKWLYPLTSTGEIREIACDGLFVAIGRQPDTTLFAG